MAEIRRLDPGTTSIKEIVEGINRITDIVVGNLPGRLALLDDSGVWQNIQGGTQLGTAEPALKLRSAGGEHLLVQHSDGVTTLLEVQDSGVTISDLHLLTDLDVDGDVNIDGELVVDGNVTLGNANTDAVSIAGVVTIGPNTQINGATEKMRIHRTSYNSSYDLSIGTGGIWSDGDVIASNLGATNGLAVGVGGATIGGPMSVTGQLTLATVVSWSDYSGGGISTGASSNGTMFVTFPGVGVKKVPWYN